MNRPPVSAARRRLRLLGLLLGALFLLWLPVEDLSEAWAILLAGLLCALAAVAIALKWVHFRKPAGGVLLGALAGLAVTPAALLLMAFKTGVHGHAAPDFTPAQVTSTLLRAPIWILAGILTGLGASLWGRR